MTLHTCSAHLPLAAALFPLLASLASADGYPPVPEETLRAMEASRGRVREFVEGRVGEWVPASGSRDKVRLKDGTVLEGKFLDWGTWFAVVSPAGRQVLERARLESVEFHSAVAADSRADKPDLGVTFIERLPRLRSNHDNVTYEKDLPRLRQSNPDPMWPVEGQEATFIAHVRNHGTVPSPGFSFEWTIDGAAAGAGKGGGLKPGEETEFRLKWPWKRGEHSVAFAIRPAEGDFSAVNDRLEDRTDAVGFLIVVERSTFEGFARVPNLVDTFSFEDWVQAHFRVTNFLFMDSIFPACPQGCLDRWRVDRIVVVDAGGASFDRETWDKSLRELMADGKGEGVRYEGTWKFVPWDEYPRRAAAIDWGFIHEMGHQQGLIDLYALDRRVTLTLRDGSRRSLVHMYHDSADMMYNHGPHRFGEFHSTALNLQRGRHRGFYGDFLYDLPDRFRLRVLDSGGDPAPGVPVRVWQPTGDRLEGPPVIEGKTDSGGALELPNRPVPGSPHATPEGFTLRPNPFGLIKVVGGNAVLLVEVGSGATTEFHAVELPQLVVARWRGAAKSCIWEIRTRLAARGALPAPEILGCSTPAAHTAEIRWRMPASRPIGGFAVFAQEDLLADSDDAPREVARVAAGAPLEARVRFRDAARDGGPAPRRMRLCVAALEPDGTPGTRSRTVCAIDTFLGGRLDAAADGTLVVADLHNHGGDIFVRQPEGWFLPVRLQPEGLTRENFLGVPTDIAIDRQERIAACFPGQKNVALFSPQLQGLSRLELPDGWQDPRGVAFDREGNLYVLDAGAGSLAVFLPDGTLSLTLPGLAGRLQEPTALSCGHSALLYAVDAATCAVLVLKPDRKAVTVTQTLKVPFERPCDAAVDGEGRVFVVGERGGLAAFSSSGRLLHSDPKFARARGIALLGTRAVLARDEILEEVPIADLLR